MIQCTFAIFYRLHKFVKPINKFGDVYQQKRTGDCDGQKHKYAWEWSWYFYFWPVLQVSTFDFNLATQWNFLSEAVAKSSK